MPTVRYYPENRTLSIRLEQEDSETDLIDLGNLLTQFLDRKLRTLGNGITGAMKEGRRLNQPTVKIK
jgi:hypothetical protein